MEDLQKFIEANINEDPSRLRLKYHGRRDLPFDVETAITQIECRRRFGKKLSDTLASNPHFFFPSVIAGEQSTSDLLASRHASMLADTATETTPLRVIDCTAGLGIDALHLAAAGASVTAVDIDPAKCKALEMNSCGRIAVVNADCREYLQTLAPQSADAIFIDPARRSADGSRVYSLSDCQPDVTAMLPDIQRVAPRLIVKASPMLDITHTASAIEGTHTVMALGTHAECKELVVDARFSACNDADSTEYSVQAVTLMSDGTCSIFRFTPREERMAVCAYGTPTPGCILYEPYPAAMKAGGVKLMASRFMLTKLHPNTHLYFSPPAEIAPAADTVAFPGIPYSVEAVIPYESKHIKKIKKTYPRISVATRNFGDSAENLRSKLGVKEGGDLRLAGVTLADNSRALLILRSIFK